MLIHLESHKWVGDLCERDFAGSEGVSVAIVEYQGTVLYFRMLLVDQAEIERRVAVERCVGKGLPGGMASIRPLHASPGWRCEQFIPIELKNYEKQTLFNE
jgi:hypothetical protein